VWTTSDKLTVTIFNQTAEDERAYDNFFFIGLSGERIDCFSRLAMTNPEQASYVAKRAFELVYTLLSKIALEEEDYKMLTLLNILADMIKERSK